MQHDAVCVRSTRLATQLFLPMRAEHGVTLDSHSFAALLTSCSNVFGTSVESAGIFGPDSVVVVWALEEDAAIPEVSAIGRG